MAAAWPEMILTTIFFDEGGQSVKFVTLSWEIHGPCFSPGARCFQMRDAFRCARQGVTVGWNDFF